MIVEHAQRHGARKQAMMTLKKILPWRSRKGPIDYADPNQFPLAAERTEVRRTTGQYVVGFLEVDGTSMRIRAVCCQPGWWFDAARPIGDNFDLLYRFRSRQAAHQWLAQHFPDSGWRVINLTRLAVGDRD